MNGTNFNRILHFSHANRDADVYKLRFHFVVIFFFFCFRSVMDRTTCDNNACDSKN